MLPVWSVKKIILYAFAPTEIKRSPSTDQNKQDVDARAADTRPEEQDPYGPYGPGGQYGPCGRYGRPCPSDTAAG